MSGKNPPYKELTLRQLQSFCEVARLGSLKAAAESLHVASPTVWAQVHALEKQLGLTLVEGSSTGCLLTPAGELLEKLARDPVSDLTTLPRRIREALGNVDVQLTVAATPSVLVEHLPRCVVDYENQHPNVHLILKEMRVEDVARAVESGEGDVGMSVDSWPAPRNPRLIYEPAYELDVILVTPENHPLARKRMVRPDDLCEYPVVNSPEGAPDPGLRAALHKIGLFETGPRRVEAFYTAAIRTYVEMGFGIGLILALPDSQPHPGLHQRSMSRFFGRLPVYYLWRRRSKEDEPARQFADLVQDRLFRGVARRVPSAK